MIYAVNPFGADHQSSEHDPSYGDYPERMAEIGLQDPQPADVLNVEKVRYALTTEYLYSALDTVNMCQFVYGPAWHLYGPEQLAEAVRLITGWDVTLEEIMQVGRRRLNLLRVFNAGAGLGRDEDNLPTKMYKKLKGGASDGIALSQEELETAKDTYYQNAGWDVHTGTPTRETLEDLDLGWVVDLVE